MEEAKVALIPKVKSEGNQETLTFRPICLLDTPGKLLETLVKNRLEVELEDNAAISSRQFGFRSGRSTIHAAEWVAKKVKETQSKWCLFVTIDIKNAFNSASWAVILNCLDRIGVSNYIKAIMQTISLKGR